MRETPEQRVSPEQLAVCSRVIQEVSRSYCKRTWWADPLDLQQEVWAEVLEALARKPVPDEYLSGTVYRIAVRRCAAYLWEQSTPVTGARGVRQRFAGLRGVPLQQRPLSGAPERERPELTEHALPDARLRAVEAEVQLELAREELYWRVSELYAEQLEALGREARSMLFEACLRVLVDGSPSREVAESLCRPLSEVYSETARVKKLIKHDATSCELLEEIAEWRQVLKV